LNLKNPNNSFKNQRYKNTNSNSSDYDGGSTSDIVNPNKDINIKSNHDELNNVVKDDEDKISVKSMEIDDQHGKVIEKHKNDTTPRNYLNSSRKYSVELESEKI